MEPIPMACPKCEATWKLVKAGQGPIICPKCKAPLDGTSVAKSESSTLGPRTAASAPVPATSQVSDEDDPGLRGGFAARPAAPEQSRRGMHPLLRASIILIALLILVPLAAFVLFAVVCAVLVAS